MLLIKSRKLRDHTITVLYLVANKTLMVIFCACVVGSKFNNFARVSALSFSRNVFKQTKETILPHSVSF